MTSEEGSVDLPLSLEDLCFLHLVCNIEHFPPESLSLLPTKLHCRLLLNLPIVDICKLGTSAVASEADFNSNVWEPLCHTRLPKDLVVADLHQGDDNWQEVFFYSLTFIILNCYFPFPRSASDLPKFGQAILFAVPECVGIRNWHQLGIQHRLHVTEVDRLKLHNPWFAPPRYGWIANPLRQCHSTSQLLHIVMKECNYEPKRVTIICDQFSHSELMITHCFRGLLQKFLSQVESLVLMASLYLPEDEEEYTEEFDNEEDTCRVIPRFILEVFLSMEQPRLQSLTIEGSIEFLAHTLRCTVPFLAESESTDSYSLQSVYKETMSNVPYGRLKDITVRLSRHEFDTHFISDTSSYLSRLITYQSSHSLSHVWLDSWPGPILGSNQITKSLVSLCLKPQFEFLALKNMTLCVAVLKFLLDTFMYAHSTDLTLDLGNITVISLDSHIDFPPEAVVRLDKEAEEDSIGKNLWCTGMRFSDSATAASFFNWLSSKELLKLEQFIVRFTEVIESQSICDCIAANPNARINCLGICDPGLQVSSASTFEAILQNLQVEWLSFSDCNIGPNGLLPLLTQGLHKQSPVQTLTYLHLLISENTLGQCPDAELRAFFDVILSLPEPQKLILILERNGFDAHHLNILCTSWREANARRRSGLASLHIADQDLCEPNMIPGLMNVAQCLVYQCEVWTDA